MKARLNGNVFVTKELLKEATRQVVQERYDKIASDAMVQTLALVLMTLDKGYGWKEKRLKAFFDNFQGIADFISLEDILGNKADTDMCISYIKEKYGIDLDKVRQDFETY